MLVSIFGGGLSLVGGGALRSRRWTVPRAQAARWGWSVAKRAVDVVADEWLRRLTSSTEGAAPTRRAVKTPAVSRETMGVLRGRDVSRETTGSVGSGGKRDGDGGAVGMMPRCGRDVGDRNVGGGGRRCGGPKG